MLIYACVSGHGYGHGSRVASVLSALHRLQPDWRLVLSTPLSASFLRLAFGPVPFEHRPCRWDVGVLQADALGSDPAATLVALEALEQALPQQIAAEQAWLEQQREPLLVLADVPPAAADLARALGAPLVFMGNFGWDAIYGPLGRAFAPWAAAATARYRQGTALIACPFAMAMPWGLPTTAVGLTPGRPREDSAGLRRRLRLETARDHTVLVGFGGMGLAVDRSLFEAWPQHHFLAADPALDCGATNLTRIPGDVRPLELLPLCGRVLTKPGYSTYCEAMAAGVGLQVVRRDGFAEAPVLEQALQRHSWHRLISRDQLQQGDWQLDRPLLPATEAPLADGGDRQAAECLQALACNR
ncbi:MAG: hypothetical protein ACKOCA_08720 [Vulcanococcus sp.]